MPQLDWNATINTIRETLPQTQFQNWFKPLQLIRFDETSVVVGVPSRFHEEWLRSHYGRHLKDAIRKQTGSDLQLEFEVLVQQENAEAMLSNPIPGARPQLHVIKGEAQHEPPSSYYGQNQEDELTQESLPQAPEVPLNVPPYAHPFIELEYNQFAYQCAHLLVKNKLPVNPLVIQAQVGMGKTHLLSEIGHSLKRVDSKLRIRYTNCESFTAEMVEHLKRNDILSFKRKYRDQTDVLLFDDVQGIGGRTRTQEELLHIFNEIIAKGGHVAFTCSVPPQKLEEFIDPLRSRLLSGLICEVKPPTFEEKVSILAGVCEYSRMALDAMLLRNLADQGQKDIRELVGTLFRIHLQSKLENKPLDSDFLAKEGWLREKTALKEAVTLDEIIGLVEHNYGVPRTELVSKSRKSSTTWARQVAMYLARHHTLLPLEEIGKNFGRDHATVIHAFQKVTETMESQPTRRYEVEFLKKKLQSRSPEPMKDDFPTF